METEFGKIRKRKWKWLKKKQEIKRVRLDTGKFFLKACLQHEFRETWPASQSNKIDTLSILGLDDGFSLQVVAGDTVNWSLGEGGYSGFQVTGIRSTGDKNQNPKTFLDQI